MNTKIVAVSALLSLMLTGCIDTGSGEKVGVITKLAQQGLFCKTWEGEIVRGGMSNGSGVNGQSYHFTIEGSDAMVEKIKAAMENQTEVKIKYRTEFGTFCRSDSPSNAFLTSVDELSTASRPLKTEPVSIQPVSDVKPQTSDEKIMQLLKVQSDLINELAKKQGK